jgi:hypothetical protein
MKIHLFLFAIFVILIVSCAPAGNTAPEPLIQNTQTTEASKVQSTPTQDESPLPTEAPAASSADECQISSNLKQEWDVRKCDEFDNNNNNWWVGSDAGDLSSTEARIADGKYSFNLVFKPNSRYLGAIYQWYNLSSINTNYLVSIDGMITSKHKTISWGLGIRGKGDRDFYTLQITNNGGYYVTRLKDGKFTTISSYHANSNIRWNESNNLTVLVEGNSYSFYVNDELIFSKKTENAVDPRIFLVLSGAEGTTIDYEFDNLFIKSE